MEKIVFQVINEKYRFVISHQQGFTTLTTYLFDDVIDAGKLISEVQLSSSESKMLLLLLKNQGRVVTKDEIMSEVWKNKFVTENSIRQVIFTLRRFLFDQEKPYRLLMNSRGVGYTLLNSQKIVAKNNKTEVFSSRIVPELRPHNDNVPDSFVRKVFSRLLSLVNMPHHARVVNK